MSLHALARRWRPWLQTLALDRARLQGLYLVLLVGVTLFFALLQPDRIVQQAHLAHALLVTALWPLLRWPRRRALAVHAATALTVLLVIGIAWRSGGVNSSSLAWLCVIAVAVLMLQGFRALRVWMVLILLTILGLKLGIDRGWLLPTVRIGPEGVLWALSNHMLAVLTLVFVVLIYDLNHRQQHEDLEQRNEELRRVHQALMRAQALKDEFVAAVGHELRTPMNAILGFNGVLQRELADRPAQLEVVGHIRTSTAQLLQVVNDILDVSQLRAGRLVLHPVDYNVAALVQEALQRHQQSAQQRGLQLSAEVDPALPAALHGDRQRLLQILHNLLDNAIKYTEQGAVALRLMRQQDLLRVQVHDSGCGIDAHRLPHIFNRFGFADEARQRVHGGTGLGLALCDGLAQLMGGQIGVHSQPGQGSVFWLLLPLQPALAPLQEEEEHAGVLLESPVALRILVVDDNAVNLQVARLQLHRIWPQAQIETAASAAHALDLLQGQSFDVALVDMVMPGMDGLQLTQQIRRQFAARATRMPILALTANTNPVEREQCLAAGMDGVLHKPIDLDAVRQSISDHVRKARA